MRMSTKIRSEAPRRVGTKRSSRRATYTCTGARFYLASTPDEEDRAGHEQEREHDPPEPDGVDAMEEAHAEHGPGQRGDDVRAGQPHDLGSDEARDPVAEEDHALVHDEERLQVGLE